MPHFGHQAARGVNGEPDPANALPIGVQVKILSRRAQSRRGFLRNVATVVAIATPIVIVPILLQSGAEAGARTTFSGPACDQGQLDISGLTVGSDASVTVALNETDCDHQVVSLVAYQAQGPDYNSAGTQV